MPQAAPRKSYADAPRLPAEGVLDLRTLFAAQPAAVELEIGCARAGFLLERLQAEPAACLVGLEITLKAASLAADKVRARGYAEHCCVFAEDVRLVLPRLEPATLQRVFVHFPDPWWKKRHGKRRLSTPQVAAQISEALVDGGELFIQSDVEHVSAAFAAAIAEVPTLVAAGDSPWIADNPYQACSPRERQASADGLPIFRLRYRRRPR